MTTSVSTISVREMAQSSSAVTRQLARRLFERIQATPESEVYLDFTGIHYATRSFFNELASKAILIAAMQKQVRYSNLSPELAQLQVIASRPLQEMVSPPINVGVSGEVIKI